MSRWLPELMRRAPSTLLALDAHGYAYAARGDVLTGRHEDLAATFGGPKAAERINVAVASDVAVHWLQSVPRSLASLQELERIAAARCAQLFGGQPADWWVAGDWRSAGPVLCMALPRAFVTRIEAMVPALSDARWTSAFSLVLERSGAAAPGWSCVRSFSTLLLWHAHAEGIDSLQVLAVDPLADAAGLRTRVQQAIVLEHARNGIACDMQVRWIDLTDAHSTTASPPKSEAEAVLALGAVEVVAAR